MKKVLGGLAAVILLLVLVIPALAASPQAGQCVGYNDPANTKVDTSDDSIVLPAGLTVCIHASDNNTGQFTTDGVKTLGQYILDSGLLNNGGQVPGVSNYVIYGAQPSPTPTPTSTPTSTPSPSPSASPTSTPTPSEEPTPTPTVSPSPTVAPTPSFTSTPSSTPNVTPPPTDTETAATTGVSTPPVWLLIPLAVIAFAIGYTLTGRKVR